MARAAAIWAAKAQPKLAAFNVKGTAAGKVVIPATVSDGPGKGRQVDCTIHPSDLDAAMAMIKKALDARNAETAWRESRKAEAKTEDWAERLPKAKPAKKAAKKAVEKSGIDTLREMLTLEPVPAQRKPEKVAPKKANGHGGARRMINPPNPEKKMMKCLCGCDLQHFNINGYVYGHKLDPRAVGAK